MRRTISDTLHSLHRIYSFNERVSLNTYLMCRKNNNEISHIKTATVIILNSFTMDLNLSS